MPEQPSPVSPPQMPSLPIDILFSILQFLPKNDGFALSSVSRNTRQELLPFLCSDVMISGSEAKKALSNAMENPSQALLNAIKNVTIALYEDDDSCVALALRLPLAPNIQSLKFLYFTFSFAQLLSLVSLLRNAQLQEVDFELDTSTEGQIIIGLQNLKYLHIHLSPRSSDTAASVDLDHFLEAFLEPSIETLEYLSLAFLYPEDHLELDRLKPGVNLRTLKLHSEHNATNLIPILPDIFPNLEDLSLHMRMGDAPIYKKSYTTSFSRLSSLAILTLNLDLDRPDNDDPNGRDLGYFDRSLRRRISPSRDLAEACPALQRIHWFLEVPQVSHQFGVVETPEGRVVKIGWDWWMHEIQSARRTGPLPDGIVNLDPARNRIYGYYGP